MPAVDLGRPYRDVRLTTSDGLRLRAWYVPSRNGAAVIAFPGRSQPVPHARMLIRHGYGVLLLDRRGEGASEGDYNAFGWAGEPDLRAAHRRSCGGSRTSTRPGSAGSGCRSAASCCSRPPRTRRALRAVVSEGAGQRSLAEHLDNPELGRVQRWFSGMLAQTAAVAVLSNGPPPRVLADLVPRIAPRRVLLIEAVNGNPDEILNEVYARAAALRPSSGRSRRAATPARSPPCRPSTSSGSRRSSTAPCGEPAAASVTAPDGWNAARR